MNNTDTANNKDESSKAVLMSEGVEVSDKHRLLKRGLKIFFGFFTPILLALIFTFGLLNHISIKIIETKSEQLTELFGVYTAIKKDPVAPEDVEAFKTYMYHSPSGDTAIGWIIALAIERIDGDSDLGEALVRQGLHRLQGAELALFISTLDDQVKGFRPEGYTDHLVTMPDMSEKLAQAVRDNRDIYALSESELEALKACEKELLRQAEKYSFMKGYEAVINTVTPNLLMDGCTLTGKIDI